MAEACVEFPLRAIGCVAAERLERRGVQQPELSCHPQLCQGPEALCGLLELEEAAVGIVSKVQPLFSQEVLGP